MSGWKPITTFPPTSILFLQLLLVITAFIWQVWIGCHGNSLIDMEEKPKILKCFGQRRSRVDWNSWKQANWLALIIFPVNPLSPNIYVVVNFLSQVIFIFLLFLGMVIYANEVETKEK